MLQDLGKQAFGYGWVAPVLLIATYNEDGSVNAMNLHEAMRTNAGDLALCVGPRSKTHLNIETRGAFTVSLVSQEQMAAADLLGSVSGFAVPDKFARTGLQAKKSAHVDAPIIEGSPVVVECELIEIAKGTNFSTILAKIVNVAADQSLINEKGKIDMQKSDMIFYEPFGTHYVGLGPVVGQPWGEGKKLL
ncbi:MAG: flavin reductase family protein [Veillonella sp.]|nr:flavin reductase family protein [Veillonella sp.]